MKPASLSAKPFGRAEISRRLLRVADSLLGRRSGIESCFLVFGWIWRANHTSAHPASDVTNATAQHLQFGDFMRQRVENIAHALRLASQRLAGDPATTCATLALQTEQLAALHHDAEETLTQLSVLFAPGRDSPQVAAFRTLISVLGVETIELASLLDQLRPGCPASAVPIVRYTTQREREVHHRHTGEPAPAPDTADVAEFFDHPVAETHD